MRTPPIPSADRSSPRLAVGDVVVYASHGIGRIASTHAAEGTEPARVILLLESGLRVTLPLVRAVITEILTAHFFVTRPHYLKTMQQLAEIDLRI